MSTFLQLNTIFISILIEAIPFVLIGVFVAGFIQIFVKEELVAKLIPKNKFLAVLYGTLIGGLFPACECGIVPIVRRLMMKGVPLYIAIPFMLTGPVINPIVMFSTYIAFGNQWDIMIYRGCIALLVAFIIGILISYLFNGNQMLQISSSSSCSQITNLSFMQKMVDMLRHAIEEFFSVGKYLIIGAFIAAAMQTFLKTSTLLEMGQTEVTSSLVMMGLAYVLSLCSEADAFIASSFSGTFSIGALVAFLVYGPMVDIKNMLMMLSVFNKRFVFILIMLITILVLLGSLMI
ncbi:MULTISPECIES: permease [Bacillus]|uniref:permease n=1 Tax=Bacillus TaxID=1386 RepID=UPI000316DB51|nr:MULTISPECIES: permease [Bacillus]